MKTALISGGIALLATLGISTMALAGMSADFDGDGVYDVLDNCSQLANAPAPADCDTDNDGYGNACDGDFDQDTYTAPGDFTIWNTDFTSTGLDGGTGTDMDCDDYVSPADFSAWNSQFTSTGIPGPSGLHCAGTVPCDL